jgi:O-antigen ligase
MFSISAIAVAERFSVSTITLWVFTTTGTYLVLGLIAEIAFGTFEPLSSEYRFGGTLHPNHQGINCAMLVISCLSLFIISSKKRCIYITIAIMALILLVLTKSRTSFASTNLALLFYCIFVWNGKRKIYGIIILGFFSSLILLILGNDNYAVIYNSVFLGRDTSSASTLTGRIPLWQECIDYILQRPLQGYGYSSFWTPKHISEVSGAEGWVISFGHSAYLDITLELGLVGVAAFVFILFICIFKSLIYNKTFQYKSNPFFSLFLTFCAFEALLESAIITPSFIMFLNVVVLTRYGFFNTNSTERNKVNLLPRT